MRVHACAGTVIFICPVTLAVRAAMIRADKKDDSKIKVAMPWVTSDDGNTFNEDESKVGYGKAMIMMMARVR